MDALLWCEGQKEHNERKMVSIQAVELMLQKLDASASIGVTELCCYHPEHKYVRLVEEFNGTDERNEIEIYFHTIDVIESLHTALGDMLKKHYETQLEKLK